MLAWLGFGERLLDVDIGFGHWICFIKRAHRFVLMFLNGCGLL